MKVVSRFEARLLRLLRTFLRGEPAEQLGQLLEQPMPAPECLSRPAVELVQDTLARGCVRLLARHDGWRRDRHLRGERVVEGRLWERTPPTELGLRFSQHSLDFLVRMAAARADEDEAPWQPPESELTVGDRLLLYLAFDVLAVRQRVAERLAQQPAFLGNALCRLTHPEQFTRSPDAVPDFAPWTTGLGTCISEALQRSLARRWLEVERRKGGITDWRGMQALGRAQESVLQAFLTAAEQAGRTDLARFLLETLAELLPEGVRPERWTGKLADGGPRLADRSDTHRAALALLHQLPQLREWTRRARAVGYFDDGYPASQLWLADWERCQGDLLCTRAEAVIRQLDPMRPT